MASLNTNQMEMAQIIRRQQLAEALQQQAMSLEPIQHPYQIMAKMAQAWLGGRMGKSADEELQALQDQRSAALAKALGPRYEEYLSSSPAQQSPVANQPRQHLWQGEQLPNSPIPSPGPMELNQLNRVQTDPGLPQRQIDMLMAMDPEIINSVLAQKTMVDMGITPQQIAGQFRTPQQPSIQNFGTKDGRVMDKAIVGSEKYYDLVNNSPYVAIGNPSQIQRQETGPPGSMTGPQVGAVQKEIGDQVAAFNTFAKGTEYLLRQVNETPGANTLTAQLMNVGNRVVQEVKALTTAFGTKYEVGAEKAWDIAHYEDVFASMGMAGANPRVKSGFLAMAIQKAMASGLGTGRALSDYDIKNQLNTLGANQSDPRIIAGVFSDAYEYLRIYTQEKYNSFSQINPGSLTLPDMYTPSYINMIPVEQVEGFNDLSPADQLRLRTLHPNGVRQR